MNRVLRSYLCTAWVGILFCSPAFSAAKKSMLQERRAELNQRIQELKDLQNAKIEETQRSQRLNEEKLALINQGKETLFQAGKDQKRQGNKNLSEFREMSRSDYRAMKHLFEEQFQLMNEYKTLSKELDEFLPTARPRFEQLVDLKAQTPNKIVDAISGKMDLENLRYREKNAVANFESKAKILSIKHNYLEKNFKNNTLFNQKLLEKYQRRKNQLSGELRKNLAQLQVYLAKRSQVLNEALDQADQEISKTIQNLEKKQLQSNQKAQAQQEQQYQNRLEIASVVGNLNHRLKDAAKAARVDLESFGYRLKPEQTVHRYDV